MSVTFKETMTGQVRLAGESAAHPLSFNLTIDVPSINDHFDNPDAWADATGWVDCDAFGGRRPIAAGRFKLFLEDGGSPMAGHMLYELPFERADGQSLVLSGRKRVRDDPGFDLWRDTTTLETRIINGDTNSDIAAGTVVITPLALAKMAPTFRGSPSAIVRFLARFVKVLGSVYVPAAG